MGFYSNLGSAMPCLHGGKGQFRQLHHSKLLHLVLLIKSDLVLLVLAIGLFFLTLCRLMVKRKKLRLMVSHNFFLFLLLILN